MKERIKFIRDSRSGRYVNFYINNYNLFKDFYSGYCFLKERKRFNFNMNPTSDEIDEYIESPILTFRKMEYLLGELYNQD